MLSVEWYRDFIVSTHGASSAEARWLLANARPTRIVKHNCGLKTEIVGEARNNDDDLAPNVQNFSK